MAYTYTDQEFADIKQRYEAGETLEQIQVVHPSKSVASIRMKLVKAKVYQAQKPASGTKSSTSKSADLQAYRDAETAVGLAPF